MLRPSRGRNGLRDEARAAWAAWGADANVAPEARWPPAPWGPPAWRSSVKLKKAMEFP